MSQGGGEGGGKRESEREEAFPKRPPQLAEKYVALNGVAGHAQRVYRAGPYLVPEY